MKTACWRIVLAVFAAAGLVVVPVGTGAGGEDRPLVLFNHDAGAGSLTQFEPPITAEQVCRQLNELEGTSVGVFLFCCNIGGDVFLYPTKIGERCGAVITDWSAVHKKYRNELRRTKGNLKFLREAGLDPIRIVRRRCGELGIRFWITMRMNEIHEDDDRWGSLRSQFKLANRHLLLEKDYPLTGIGYAETYGYSYAWDYGRDETRRHILAVLGEMLDSYELDGLELDFMRHALFFRRGQHTKNAPLITDLVRKVRAKVDRVAKEKNREITLAVRVYPSLAQNARIGLDPSAWIHEGLVDMVIPMDPGYLDMQPGLREFVEAARGTDVKVAGGLENVTRDYGQVSKERAFAAASAFLEDGAEAIYFFNYDCHRRKGRLNPYAAEEIEILWTIGHPDKYARADKHYFVTRDTSRKTPEQGGTGQLPAELAPGTPREFTLTVGDDLEGARADGALASVGLSMDFSGYDAKAGRVTICVNGKVLGPERLSGSGGNLTCTDPPFRRGENRLSLLLEKSSAEVKSPVTVEKIQLKVDYK